MAPSKLPTSTIPVRCLERHPTSQTVWFAGQAINLRSIAESYSPPLDHSYLSLIFSGKRQPSLDVAKKIALALGMQLQAFVETLEKERT